MLLPGPIGSAFAMRHIARALSDSGRHVVIIDPLGMGASSRSKHADYALSAQARRVHRAIDTVLPTNASFVVAGAGTSATIALHLAANMPDRVQGVVSIAGGGNDTQGTTGLRLALALSPLLDTPMGRAFARRRFASTARAQSADASWVTSASVAGYLGDAERDVRGTLSTLQRMADSQEPQPIGPRLPTIEAPVVLLVGDKPKVSSPMSAQRLALAGGLRQFRIDTLVGAGAMLHEERPRDIVAHLVRLGPKP
ncbi:MAG: alpha/beta hydrolase [Gemmatimonadaceae bacterium]|nr:alpha/beta hydrolase [Gemmatimonadaceae bacterium]